MPYSSYLDKVSNEMNTQQNQMLADMQKTMADMAREMRELKDTNRGQVCSILKPVRLKYLSF